MSRLAMAINAIAMMKIAAATRSSGSFRNLPGLKADRLAVTNRLDRARTRNARTMSSDTGPSSEPRTIPLVDTVDIASTSA